MIVLPFFLFMHVTQKTATVETCNNMGSYLEEIMEVKKLIRNNVLTIK